MLVAQPSHPLGTLWFASHCLRLLLVGTPGRHSGLAGPCGDYIHLLLTAKRSLFDCQHLIIPSDARAGPGATAASSVTIFLQRTAPSLGFPGRPGCPPWLHPPTEGKGVLGIQPESRLSGHHFYISTSSSHLTPSSGCRCSAGICGSSAVGLYHVQVQGAVPATQRWGKGAYGDANSHVRESALCHTLTSVRLCVPGPRVTPSVPRD